MGSLAPAEKASGMDSLPELSEAEYLRDVLRQPADRTEADVDAEWAAKATALGVELSALRPGTADKPNASGPEPSATLPARHGRTFSTASSASASTSRASNHSAAAAISTPEDKEKSGSPVKLSLPRRRNKSLSFSQYEKYLDQVDSILNQPKFFNQPPPAVNKIQRPMSIFSADTKKSMKNLRRGLANKLGWKKKLASSSEHIM
jgi:hypothetical protein